MVEYEDENEDADEEFVRGEGRVGTEESFHLETRLFQIALGGLDVSNMIIWHFNSTPIYCYFKSGLHKAGRTIHSTCKARIEDQS